MAMKTMVNYVFFYNSVDEWEIMSYSYIFSVLATVEL